MTSIPYISWLGHGAIDIAPPGVFTDAKASAFVIDADKDAMQSLTDKLLNAASDGSVTYEVAAHHAMFSFVDVAQSTSGTENVGWLPGREAAIWIPLIERHKGHILKTRVILWAPYIFINYAMGMVIGRETWGWAKVLGDLEVASDNPANPQFCTTTTYFPTMAKETQGVTAPLYRIAAGSNEPEDAAQTWHSGNDAKDAIMARLLGGVLPDAKELFNFDPHVPSVALKQFREPGDTNSACYQAIVHTPIEVTGFHGGGFLKGDYSIEITTCESHQIVRDILGKEPDDGSTTVPVKFAFWSHIDFQTLPGENVVVRG